MKVNTLGLLRWVDDLTAQGRFKNHPAARTVLKHYVEYLWITEPNKQYPQAQKMHVMSGCVWPAVVAEKTGLSKRAIQKANDWLESEGFIQVVKESGSRGGLPGPVDIEVRYEPSSYGYESNSYASEPSSHPIRTDVAHKEINERENKELIKAPETSSVAKSTSDLDFLSSSGFASGASKAEKVPDRIKMFQNRHGKLRLAGKSKARPGETEIWMSQGTYERYLDEGKIDD